MEASGRRAPSFEPLLHPGYQELGKNRKRDLQPTAGIRKANRPGTTQP